MSVILVVHESDLDPEPFLNRLAGSSTSWTIDNKYYTATVSFLPFALPGTPPAHPVILYLFSKAPNPISADLTRVLVASPPDIALAVRVHGGERDENDEERLNEAGFELVDEDASPDEDDERPIEPIEGIRQTLMTHMWPNMLRKGAIMDGDEDDENNEDDEEDEDDAEDSDSGHFPIRFGTGSNAALRLEAIAASFDAMGLSDEDEDDGFGVDGFGVEVGQEEYARLDDWLEEGEGHDNHPDIHDERADTTTTAAFEDDFDDFAAFQSGPTHALPTSSMRDPPALRSTDPTPLLLHLQAVRAELAGVEDEDERRERAGREVESIMRLLGD